jgi:chromosomal replication initiation ATPase DnaA
VEKEVAADTRKARRLALYLRHRLTGRGLKEIGEAFGVGESAVTQASRRVRGQLQGNPELAEMVKRLEAELDMSEV